MDERPSARRGHRRSIRLPEYDYSQPGIYFVTVCTLNRVCWLGSVVEDSVQFSEAGQVAVSEWGQLARRFPGTGVDSLVVMPNHVHALVVIEDADAVAPLGAIVRAVKAASARTIHLGGLGEFRWQRNYYEHVVRDERELAVFREYIAQNPARWAQDSLHPSGDT